MSLKRRIIRWLKKDWHNTYSDSPEIAVSSPTTKDISGAESFNFSITPAYGGRVVQFNRYDRKTDRSENNLHLIHENEDFAERLAHIVTLELMRHGG